MLVCLPRNENMLEVEIGREEGRKGDGLDVEDKDWLG